MLWWIVAPDTISAHDVSVKILRRFRAEHSCPHHKFFKKRRAVCRLAFGFSGPPCFDHRTFLPATFRVRISSAATSTGNRPNIIITGNINVLGMILVSPGLEMNRPNFLFSLRSRRWVCHGLAHCMVIQRVFTYLHVDWTSISYLYLFPYLHLYVYIWVYIYVYKIYVYCIYI